MCGRYTLTTEPEELAATFGELALPLDYQPRYNIAPSQPILALLHEDGIVRWDALQWGLVPFWAKDPSIGNRMINARAETVAEKPAFRTALDRRRCLIVMDGFYEWRAGPAGKVPMRIRTADHAPFTVAGLWERWSPAGAQPLFTCTILTTSANDFMRPIHDRMPVILEAERRGRWLDPAASKPEVLELLAPYSGELDAYAVSRLVNSPRNDVPACVEPDPTALEEPQLSL